MSWFPKRAIAQAAPGESRDARPRVNALCGKPSKQIGHEFFLPAEESRRTRDIDPDPIRRTGRHDRRIADAPACQFDQRRLILAGCGLDDMQLRNQRLRMRRCLAHPQTERMGVVIDGADQTPGPFRPDRHQGFIRRRRAAGASDPVGRPGRQVERDDPSHRKPRESGMGFAATAAQKIHLPAGPAKPRRRRRVGHERRDAPSGGSGTRQTGEFLLGDIPPATEDESRHTGCFGRQLEPARGSQPEPGDLADHRRQTFFPQSLFHGGQDVLLAKGLGEDHPVRMQPCIHEARRKEVAPVEAPQNGASQPGGDPRGKKRGRAREFTRRASFDDVMEGSLRKPSSGQPEIHLRNAERQGGRRRNCPSNRPISCRKPARTSFCPACMDLAQLISHQECSYFVLVTTESQPKSLALS